MVSREGGPSAHDSHPPPPPTPFSSLVAPRSPALRASPPPGSASCPPRFAAPCSGRRASGIAHCAGGRVPCPRLAAPGMGDRLDTSLRTSAALPLASDGARECARSHLPTLADVPGRATCAPTLAVRLQSVPDTRRIVYPCWLPLPVTLTYASPGRLRDAPARARESPLLSTIRRPTPCLAHPFCARGMLGFLRLSPTHPMSRVPASRVRVHEETLPFLSISLTYPMTHVPAFFGGHNRPHSVPFSSPFAWGSMDHALALPIAPRAQAPGPP